MSQTCSNLATKADLDALAAELNSKLKGKIDNVEKASIVSISSQQGLALALVALAPKIAKAVAAAGVIAAKVAAISASVGFLVAQVAALALQQYLISKNTQKINKNTKLIQSNSTQISKNTSQINKIKSQLIAQQAQIDSLKAQYPKLQQQINSTKVAISQNKSAIALTEKKIAQNNKKIAITEVKLQNKIAKAEQKLKKDINSANAQLNNKIVSAEAKLNKKINAVNTQIIGLKAQTSVSISKLKQQSVSQIQNVSSKLASTQGKVTELQVKLALANGDAVIVKKKTKSIEKKVNNIDTSFKKFTGTSFSLGNPLQDLSKSINDTKAIATANTINVTNSNTKIKDLTSKITALETAQVDTTQVEKLRTDISKDTQTIIAATLGTLVLPKLELVNNNTSPTAISSATNNALCQQAANPNSCLNTSLGNSIKNNLGNIASGINAGASAANTALNTNILNRVTDIQNKVNSSTFGLQATKQFLDKAWNATGADKVLNAMNTVLALHNAYMLSRNLGQSIGDAASSILSAFNIKDSSGEEIDVNKFLSNRITDFVNKTIGAENAQALSTVLLSTNRIIVSAQGVISSVRGIKDAIQNGQEIIANRVGFLGNSFMSQGLLEEDSFPWMETNNNFRNPFARFNQQVGNVQEFVDEINELAATGIEVKDNFSELTDEIENFSEARTELEESLKEFSEDTQKKEDKAEVFNRSPDITNIDLVKKEE